MTGWSGVPRKSLRKDAVTSHDGRWMLRCNKPGPLWGQIRASDGGRGDVSSTSAARAQQCRYTMQIPGWPYAHGLPQSGDDNRLVAAIGYMSHAKSKRDVSGVALTSTIGCV